MNKDLAYIKLMLEDISTIADKTTSGNVSHNIATIKCDARKALECIDNQKEPVSEDLEEAAIMHYKDVMEYEVKTGLKPAYMTSFKAGAQWQKNQGIVEDAEINYWNQRGLSIRTDKSLEYLGYEEGDKVKIIIVKE